MDSIFCDNKLILGFRKKFHGKLDIMVHIAFSTISDSKKKEKLNFKSIPDQMVFTAEYLKDKMDETKTTTDQVLQYFASYFQIKSFY